MTRTILSTATAIPSCALSPLAIAMAIAVAATVPRPPPLRCEEPPGPEALYEARTLSYSGDGSSERTLLYRLLKPAGLELQSGRKWPLILFLHGAGERGDDNRTQLKYFPAFMAEPEARDRYRAFILAPQCPRERTWSSKSIRDLLEDPSSQTGGSPVEPVGEAQAVLEALEEVMEELPVDPDRLYLTGLSMGGYGSWHLAALRPDRWAAVVPICGGGSPAIARRIKDIPIWAFHGAKDPVVPPERSRAMVEALREAGGEPRYTEFPDAGHDSWTPAYRHPELLPWLFAQRRPAAAPARAAEGARIPLEGEKCVLRAAEAEPTGSIRLEGSRRDLGGWKAPSDAARWRIRAKEAARLDVSAAYACAPGSGGSVIEVSCGESRVTGRILESGGWEDFLTVPLGMLSVPAGDSEVAVRVVSRPEGAEGPLLLRELELERGFVSLTEGDSLDAWEDAVEGYVVKDGVLTCKEHGGGYLRTKEDHANFIFRFEFLLPRGGNNGVGIRAERSGDPAYRGFEIQILDDPAYKGQIQDYQRHGSIYRAQAAKPGHLRPTGEWNVEEIRADGRRVTVTLNGVAIVDADLDEVEKRLLSKPGGKEVVDSIDGFRRATGCIAFCGHGSAVQFRNIRLKDLPDKE